MGGETVIDERLKPVWPNEPRHQISDDPNDLRATQTVDEDSSYEVIHGIEHTLQYDRAFRICRQLPLFTGHLIQRGDEK